jgi:hypothetical protein
VSDWSIILTLTSCITMPASQLSQLKSALTSSGLNRKNTSKKDKKAFKKGGSREVDRQKTLAKLEDIRKGLNKFDERETKVCALDSCQADCSSNTMSGAGTSRELLDDLVQANRRVSIR